MPCQNTTFALMIAVTGASSQIGKSLIPHLLDKGEKVRILISENQLPSHFKEHEHLEWMKGSIMDVTDLEQLMEGVTMIYHTAGLESLVVSNKKKLYKENVDGTANVVNAGLAAKVKKLIVFSSIYSLGDKAENGEFDEQTRWSNMKQASGYGWSMHLAEREVWRGVTEGLPAIILQNGLVLSGPGEESISGEIMESCLEMNNSYPSGLANVIDVRDVVDIAASLAGSENENEQFILVGHRISYKDIMNSMSQLGEKRHHVRELSYVNLSRKALMSRPLSFLQRRKNPIMTQALAQVLCDRRSFSNKKLSELLAYEFIDVNESLKHYGVT